AACPELREHTFSLFRISVAGRLHELNSLLLSSRSRDSRWSHRRSVLVVSDASAASTVTRDPQETDPQRRVVLTHDWTDDVTRR
ncbi:MAG: hypothetical protein KDA51_03715, partial [Planctomycetales bacterium]|nr:hypothetical protein [Planctomycetales bacterium]